MAYDATRVLDALRARGFAARVSADAGQYLCEEALFTALRWQCAAGDAARARLAAFVHVPVLGRQCARAALLADAADAPAAADALACDEELLERFGAAVVDCLVHEWRQLQAQRAPAAPSAAAGERAAAAAESGD